MKPLSVSILNAQIQSLIESTFVEVLVEGEVSNLTKHSSGHYYFSIKDENSSIRCVMFRGNVSKLKFDLQNNQKILLKGAVSVYVPRGEYQVVCSSIEPSGYGDLHFAFEQLKQKLQERGFFDSRFKKQLPKFPKKIALITSKTGAALQDMLHVAQSRWNLVKLVNINTLVQGDGAKESIVQSIKIADSFFGTSEAFDVIVLARGGGSLEDLWAFNEEVVAQAIFDANTPIVSAIGHEIDYVISDFVADLRVPTPSAAMEKVLPDKNTWFLNLDSIHNDLLSQVQKFFVPFQKQLQDYLFFLNQYKFENKFQNNKKVLEELHKMISLKMENILVKKNTQLLQDYLDNAIKSFLFKKDLIYKEAKAKLEGKNLDNLCRNGYAQIIYQDKVVPLNKLKQNDLIEIVSTDTQVDAIVQRVKTNS
ncbi:MULTISPECIES: exodeoxyribonuclease VII large subunit [unclassified Helicobacter]|uniref:exodeoxyribonuclease VII large subunit n=1 Tax=unclassified Helicobacter TaxID=2593540 RepID=UPI000CF0303C|nr:MULTISPECIES: exodeoxyribonuclease VII large subunit [unclassified Helicobacter]